MEALLLLLLLASLVTANVLYCDRVYQLQDRYVIQYLYPTSHSTNPRTDESEASCKWSVGPGERKELLGTLDACKDGTDEEGLLCGQECVSYNEWCRTGTKVGTVSLFHVIFPRFPIIVGPCSKTGLCAGTQPFGRRESVLKAAPGAEDVLSPLSEVTTSGVESGGWESALLLKPVTHRGGQTGFLAQFFISMIE